MLYFTQHNDMIALWLNALRMRGGCCCRSCESGCGSGKTPHSQEVCRAMINKVDIGQVAREMCEVTKADCFILSSAGGEAAYER